MTELPLPIQALVLALKSLPGIGPRSAERMALHVIQMEPERVRALSEALMFARERIVACERCGGLTESQPCRICSDGQRDAGMLCVVERPTDILSFEKSGTFRGRYHVLGGKLSPLDGVGPEDLRIRELEARMSEGPVREVVVALSGDVDGEATAHYIRQRLAGAGVRITRLAQGLPAGAGLEYADELTLSRALEGRREFS
jgi:recombination protein RecR